MNSLLKRLYSGVAIASRPLRAPFEKKLLSLNSNISLRDLSHSRCFIIGNGPSLSNLDLSILRNEDVFTCNLFANSTHFKSINSTYHVFTDTRFFDLEDKDERLEAVLRAFDSCEKNGVKRLFLESDAFQFVKKNGLDKRFDISYIAQNPHAKLKSNLKLSGYLPHHWTVIQCEICIAYCLGYSEIYLLGCDCTGFITNAKALLNENIEDNYGFDLSNSEIKLLKRNMSIEPIEEELRRYVKIFEDYRTLYDFCTQNNVLLANLTKGGLLNSLPRFEIEEIITDRFKHN